MHNAKFVLLLLYQWLAQILAQFAPSYDGAIRPGGPAGSLPFPLFPMPCEMICEHGGLFFANINIINAASQPKIGGGAGGMPGNGGGGIGGAGNGIGGMASGSMNGGASSMGGMPGSMGGMAGSMGGMPGNMGGMPGNMGGMPGSMGGMSGSMGGVPGNMGGMPGSMGGMPGSMGGMPGGGPGSMAGNSYATKPPGMSGSPNGGFLTTTPKPNINAQIFYVYPSWCTGWCRFLWRPRPVYPPPPQPSHYPHPACVLFSWLGL